MNSVEKGTIYHRTAIGIKKIEAREIKWSIGEFAQYTNGIIITFIPKRKKLERLMETADSNIVIFEGWGHPEPPTAGVTTDPNIENIISITTFEISKGSIKKNKKKFSQFIDNYLNKEKGKLAVDFREHIV
jgi:hypothetical protein